MQAGLPHPRIGKKIGDGFQTAANNMTNLTTNDNPSLTRHKTSVAIQLFLVVSSDGEGVVNYVEVKTLEFLAGVEGRGNKTWAFIHTHIEIYIYS